MARHYDRIIRFYESWFDDLSDPTKELTSDEQLSIIKAIVDAQVLGSSEPLRNLPIAIRRCLSMATLCEQIERMLERSERMRNRGRLGGLAAAGNKSVQEIIDQDNEQLITSAPDDGLEHNIQGYTETMQKWGLTNKQINIIITKSNYLQIGHPVCKLLYSAQSKKDPKAWLTSIFKF